MRRQARKLTANSSDEQFQKEKNLLLAKLNRLGMLDENAGLEDVLRMTPESFLERRLQTQVYLQGLSSTVRQARQLIVHGHISIDGAVARVPGILVTRPQEKSISYSPASALNSDLHPVRPGIQETFEDEVEGKTQDNEKVKGESEDNAKTDAKTDSKKDKETETDKEEEKK